MWMWIHPTDGRFCQESDLNCWEPLCCDPETWHSLQLSDSSALSDPQWICWVETGSWAGASATCTDALALFSLQICPICAALPGGDPNHVTDDFAAHLTLEHRAPRDLISFQEAAWEALVVILLVLIVLGNSIPREKDTKSPGYFYLLDLFIKVTLLFCRLIMLLSGYKLPF